MNKKEKIRIALYAIRKNMSCDNLYYCDDMYGHEDETESVWEYVEEYMKIGSLAFNEKYKELI